MPFYKSPFYRHFATHHHTKKLQEISYGMRQTEKSGYKEREFKKAFFIEKKKCSMYVRLYI